MTTLRIQVVNSGTVQDPDVDDVLTLSSSSDGQGILALSADAVTSGAIADQSVTTAKIADLAVTTAKIADDAVGTLQAKASDGTTPAVPVALPVAVADGVTADASSFEADRDYRVLGGQFFKADGAGDTADAFEFRTAAGGAGSAIFGVDLNVADGTPAPFTGLDDSVVDLTSGNTYYLRRIKGAGNAACYGHILLLPL